MTVVDDTNLRAAYRDELLDAGLLVRTDVEGLYGRSGVFEDVVDGIDRVVVAAGSYLQARRLRFPPVLPRTVFARTDYLASFPNLTGSIHTFTGDDKGHARLLALHESGADWTVELEPSEVVLVPAACHPVYPTLTGTLPEGGDVIDVYSYCFRHEPAADPARMQAFRMHEFVRVGTPDDAIEHREAWIERGLDVLATLGLTAEAEIANDPFFGRAGRMLKVNQRDQALKFELVVRLYGDDVPGTAVVSANCHQDHFGTPFGIRTADGEVAHSACVGFGMERIALALFRHHGLDPASWPAPVRAAMWP